jgi:hypothetical protein
MARTIDEIITTLPKAERDAITARARELIAEEMSLQAIRKAMGKTQVAVASQDQLRQHLAAFLDAYNFAKGLKTLKGLTPFESIYKAWTNEPDRFKHEPIQLTSGLHT